MGYQWGSSKALNSKDIRYLSLLQADNYIFFGQVWILESKCVDIKDHFQCKDMLLSEVFEKWTWKLVNIFFEKNSFLLNTILLNVDRTQAKHYSILAQWDERNFKIQKVVLTVGRVQNNHFDLICNLPIMKKNIISRNFEKKKIHF